MALASAVAVPDRVAEIRAEVNEYGSAIVAGAALEALCPDRLCLPDQFLSVAKIAGEEEWDFEFIGDRIVRFSSVIAERRRSVI